ncbi:MAG: FAD-binding domain-containing protein [Pseudomonadota bacterium]
MLDPTYTNALTRLNAFVPKAGYEYAAQRNYDRPGHHNVSALSPFLRHRIITEDEVLTATLRRHSARAAEKFIQEVYWRTYWKGWLEMRPTIWAQYQIDLKAALNRVQTESGLRADWDAACSGDTGIDCFDHWAQELVATGYLHNHARMWFASIWIFTLRLPWVLGADFFLRHLLDGDPASNTLSWRWVGGIQTMGKTYLARPDNIAKFTDGRFRPTGLATYAAPLASPPHPAPAPLPSTEPFPKDRAIGLLLTEEDLSPGWLLDAVSPKATAVLQATTSRSPLHIAPNVQDFVSQALRNTHQRYGERLGAVKTTADLVSWAQNARIDHIVTSFAPVGPTAAALAQQRERLAAAGITLSQHQRRYDQQAWPFARAGFFKFKAAIPKLLPELT